MGHQIEIEIKPILDSKVIYCIVGESGAKSDFNSDSYAEKIRGQKTNIEVPDNYRNIMHVCIAYGYFTPENSRTSLENEFQTNEYRTQLFALIKKLQNDNFEGITLNIVFFNNMYKKYTRRYLGEFINEFRDKKICEVVIFDINKINSPDDLINKLQIH